MNIYWCNDCDVISCDSFSNYIPYCKKCKGKNRNFIASVDGGQVIEKLLTHLNWDKEQIKDFLQSESTILWNIK